MVTTAVLISEQEYLERYADSRDHLEFLNGEVFPKRRIGMAQKAHVVASNVFARKFFGHEDEHGGFSGTTPTTNISGGADREYRLPDIAYWAPGRPVGPSILLPPTVAVEIVSPDQSVPGLREKCRRYRDRGVDVCWLVEPERRWVEVFDGARDGERLGNSDSLTAAGMPGFAIPLRELWAGIDRGLAVP